MRSTHRHQQGFTLVEMIVVIAIIAILAAIIIPTTAGFIDRARLSNDRQNAAVMNRALTTMLIEDENLANDTLNAHDVRTLLDTFGDEPFNFNPTARNVAYFYIESAQRIIVANLNDISDPDFQFLNPDPTFNLGRLIRPTQSVSAQTILDPIRQPEEVFGTGRVMLSTEGNVVAEVASGIRTLARSQDIASAYAALVLKVDNMNSGLFSDATHQARLQELLDRFDPAHTAYVNDQRWHVQTQPPFTAWQVERIVFANNIGNVPSYPEGQRMTLLDDVVMPRTVRTVEAGAFSSLRFQNPVDNGFVFSGRALIQVEENAFPLGQQSSLLQLRNVSLMTDGWPELELIVTVDGVSYTSWEEPITLATNTTPIAVNITNLDRAALIDMKVRIQGNVVTVRAYTNRGLAGVAVIPIEITTEE